VIALLGNLSRDVFPDRPSHVGGGPYHAARALQRLRVPARVYACCAVEDRDELVLPVVRLGTPVQYVPGTSTASFAIDYEGERRLMRIEALGDTWRPENVPQLGARVRWVHVAPLARSDFPAETLEVLARHRRVCFDGQGLVRVPKLGELELDADYDPDLLRHIWVLKLSEEEAEVLGDPAQLPVREVMVTHGLRGSTIYTPGTREYVPAWALDVEPTGAGDAFSIAYVASRAAGFPPSAAARRATAVVADVLAA
jgi:sugar/nucleoside kinase (ribokinase family)